jgi:hypothetical protein
LGVSTPKTMSMHVMEAMAMITAKSEMNPRTLAEKRFWNGIVKAQLFNVINEGFFVGAT